MRGKKHKIHSSPRTSDFNTRRKSMERWHNVLIKLSEFKGLVNNFDDASLDEIQTLKAIHEKTYECYAVAKEHFNGKSIEVSITPTVNGFYKMYNLLSEVNNILKYALVRGVITERYTKLTKKISALTEEHNRRGDGLTKKILPPKIVSVIIKLIRN